MCTAGVPPRRSVPYYTISLVRPVRRAEGNDQSQKALLFKFFSKAILSETYMDNERAWPSAAGLKSHMARKD